MQTRKSSFVEALLNTIIGYVISFIAQLIVYPQFGAHFSLLDNFYIGLIFMALSLARSYVLRRWFNGMIHKAALSIGGLK